MKAIPIPVNWRTDLSIYASDPFLKAVSDEYGWLGGIDDDDNLRFILPFTIIRKPLLRLVRFRVETIPVNGTSGVLEEKAFLNSVVKYFRQHGADVIIPATTNTIFRTFPDGAVAAPYGTYILDLTQPEGELWGNLSSSHRRKIRLALKAEVKIREGVEFLEPVYRLVRDTFQRSRQGFMSYASFEKQALALGDRVKVFVAEQNGNVEGGMVVPFSQRSAYYVYGGSVPEPAAGAMNLLHWHAIQLFGSLGVKEYDFVGVRVDPEKGSKQEGLKSFKERFGGQMKRGYMWKYALNPLKFYAYNLAVRLRRGGDIVDCERHKLPGHEELPAAGATAVAGFRSEKTQDQPTQ